MHKYANTLKTYNIILCSVSDVAKEDLLSHFEDCIQFIDDCLKVQQNILVQWFVLFFYH